MYIFQRNHDNKRWLFHCLNMAFLDKSEMTHRRAGGQKNARQERMAVCVSGQVRLPYEYHSVVSFVFCTSNLTFPHHSLVKAGLILSIHRSQVHARYPEEIVGQAATTDWPQPAATMNPTNPYGGNINPQHNPYLPLTHQPAQTSSLKREITSQLVAPSDILEYERPAKRQKELVSAGMDKRHPSSFQQLEKVCHYEAPHIRNLLTAPTAGRGHLCYRITLPTPHPSIPPP